jgi:hypothetical protein
VGDFDLSPQRAAGIRRAETLGCSRHNRVSRFVNRCLFSCPASAELSRCTVAPRAGYRHGFSHLLFKLAILLCSD